MSIHTTHNQLMYVCVCVCVCVCARASVCVCVSVQLVGWVHMYIRIRYDCLRCTVVCACKDNCRAHLHNSCHLASQQIQLDRGSGRIQQCCYTAMHNHGLQNIHQYLHIAETTYVVILFSVCNKLHVITQPYTVKLIYSLSDRTYVCNYMHRRNSHMHMPCKFNDGNSQIMKTDPCKCACQALAGIPQGMSKHNFHWC